MTHGFKECLLTDGGQHAIASAARAGAAAAAAIIAAPRVCLLVQPSHFLHVQSSTPWLRTIGAGAPPSAAPVPGWLKKWAALVVAFIEEEARALPQLLVGGSEACASPRDCGGAAGGMRRGRCAFGDADPDAGAGAEGGRYTAARAAAAASRHRALRLRRLAGALDLAKLFLRHQPEGGRGPPLRPLAPEEAVAHLWTGADSVARRAVRAIAAASMRGAGAGGAGAGGAGGAPAPAPVPASLEALTARMMASVNRALVTTPEDARRRLAELAEGLAAAGLAANAAMHDVLLLHAATRTLVAATEYAPVCPCLGDVSRGRSHAAWAPCAQFATAVPASN